jgi:hypothetical protein
MLIKREPPIAASFESDVGWHACGLLASVTLTSRAHGRSTFVVVERHKTDARELQIGHALLSSLSAPGNSIFFSSIGACASPTCAWANAGQRSNRGQVSHDAATLALYFLTCRTQVPAMHKEKAPQIVWCQGISHPDSIRKITGSGTNQTLWWHTGPPRLRRNWSVHHSIYVKQQLSGPCRWAFPWERGAACHRATHVVHRPRQLSSVLHQPMSPQGAGRFGRF